MFTGIVEARVPVSAWTPVGTGGRLRLPAPDPAWEVAHGESISVSGCCLTAVGWARPEGGEEVPGPGPGLDLLFDLSAETLECTWFGDLAPGRVVNLERSLRLGDRLGGHMVSGHVDGGGTIADVRDSGDGGRVFTFEVEPGFERWIVDKGSVAIDGISLTVVEPRERLFDVAVIPATLELTSLGTASRGDRVHLESDPIGKWVEQLVAPWLAARS
jgi:riboflavin synthase